MFDCKRCGNTGRISERYYDMPPLPETPDEVVSNVEVEIKTRMIECPECIGLSAVPLRPRGYL